MKLSVNDWQDFGLKKDIEKLNKLIQRISMIGPTVFFNVVAVFCGVVFDRLFDFTNKKIAVAVFILIVFFIIASWVIFFRKEFKALIHSKFTSVVSRDIREYIDCFDNEIWIYVMMSDSFLDLLTDKMKPDKHRKTFCFSQTCFWLNKAIMKLFEMNHKLKKIFSNDNNEIVNHRKVSIARLINLLDIIFDIKKAVNENKEGLTFSDEDLTANKSYYKMLDGFLTMANIDLGVDIGRFRI
jgi:hypothetical protein